MSSLVSFAKRLMTANPTMKSSGSGSEIQAPRGSYPPISTTGTPIVTERLPLELVEQFIDYLRDDVRSLSRCSLVCHAWLPASRHLLFRSAVVHPIFLDRGIPFFTGHINCSAALRDSTHVLYGTNDGIFMVSGLYQGVVSGSSPRQVLAGVSSITHIEILEHYDLVIFLSGRQIMAIPLSTINTTTNVEGGRSCVRVSSHVSFFKVGVVAGRTVVCIVKVGLSATTIKLMEPFVTSPWQNSLRMYKDFSVSEKVISINFYGTKVVAGTHDHDFDVIDVETWASQTLLDPDVWLPKMKWGTCLAAYPIGQEVLLCYDVFAIYVDPQGRLSRSEKILWLTESVQAVAYRDPYLLAFSPTHIEVRHVETGSMVQKIWINHRLLCTSSELFMIQADDGRVIGLKFPD